jgi:FAD/FMN-containing dehydrogenase
MKSVVVDAEKKLVKVGGGATWADVDSEAAKYGLAAVGGTVNHTGEILFMDYFNVSLLLGLTVFFSGVGGLTVGGGYGWLTPKYGLVIDNLVEAEVVTGHGDILIASESSNPDLFWGIRGAGVNFGPVTSFTFKAYEQKNDVWSGILVFPPPALEALLVAAETWLKTASEDESGIIFVACPPPNFEPMLVFIPFFNGSAEEGKKRFAGIYAVGPVADMTREMPYAEVNTVQNPMTTHGDRKLLKGTAFSKFSPTRLQGQFDRYAELMAKHPEAKGSAFFLELTPHHKVNAVPRSSTAFANRGKWYNVCYTLRWKDAGLDEELRKWAAHQVELVREAEPEDLAGTTAYANYGLGDEKSKDVFHENYQRLTELKAKYDPKLIFNKWFPITPAMKA